MKTILCINGSDSMGHSGIQSDIRTVKDLGGYAVTSITSVTAQNSLGITNVHELPASLVVGQIRAIYGETHPEAVKVGMVDNPETISGIRNEIIGCPCIVCSPVILSSHGGLLMSNESIQAYCRHLVPICSLLISRCTDAEIVLGHRICTDSDMKDAVEQLHEMGATWVLLRGGTYTEGRINALLSGPGCQKFFSSVNTEGWQRHGVGGTLSTAVAMQLANGDDVSKAVENAHDYIHSQIIYSSQKSQGLQPHNLYNKFMSLLADNYTKAHDVGFYACELNISTRYLSQISNIICGRSPKQVIDDYLTRESEQLLATSSLTIQQIAYQLGFSSQMAFSKFFKAKKGCSPLSHRNRA